MRHWVAGVGCGERAVVTENERCERSKRGSLQLQLVQKLHEAGLLTIPSGTQVLRLLPPLNLAMPQAEEGLQILESEISKLA